MPKFILLCLLAGLVGPALAHPGHGLHGHDGASLWHYLSEPDHVAALGLLLALVVGLLVWLYKRKANVTLRRHD